MRLFIGVVIGLLLSANSAFAGDIFVKGGFKMETGNTLEPGITITESLQRPTNPSLNDEYVDPRTGIVEVYDGTTWVVKNTTQDIKDEIQIFKNNIAGVTDPKAKKCLKSIAKILLKLYRESAE